MSQDLSETINARLLELARERDRVDRENAALKTERDGLMIHFVAPLDAQIKANADALAEMEAALRADALAYMTETGDLHLHPALTFRRDKKLVYDREQVTQALLAEDELDLLRIDLKVRDFEKAFRAGEYQWCEVEEVPDPTLAIGRLGDLLLMESADAN